MFDRLRLALTRRLETLTGQKTEVVATADLAKVEKLRAQGKALIAEEKMDEAERCFSEALLHQPDDAPTLICIGYVLKEQGRLVEARIALKRATNTNSADPQAFEAHYLLGEISAQQSDFDDAKKYFKATLDLKPAFTRACNDLIRILQLQGEEATIRPLLEHCVRQCPDNAEYRLWLAEKYADTFSFQEMAEHLMAAVTLGVNEAPIHNTLGSALCRLGREEEARVFFELAVAVDPAVAYEGQYHLGYFHWQTGNARASAEFLEQAIALQPDYLPSHSLLLMNLSLGAIEANLSYKEAALRFGKIIQSDSSTAHAAPVTTDTRDGRILHIGFLAGEFRTHPVYHFLIGVLEQIDRTRFKLVAFSNNPVDDASTPFFKTLFDDWYDIKDLNPDAAADLVRTLQIDVLVDLSGHTGDGNLAVFARKPALVQATWLGYWASTGVEEMDYLIADPVSVPLGSDEWFSEKVVRLPTTRLCITAPRTSRAIPVAHSPCSTRGYVTFGSFQQTAKINEKVLRAWAQVLASVPDSRLRVQTQAIHSVAVRDKIRADMVRAGIDLSRVELIGAVAWEEYLEAHSEIDILLDTFPFPGGTTTAFALWMGVPTITLAGNTMLSRQGACMLECVGLSEWVVNNEDDYVAAAQKFAGDIAGLVLLRGLLRDVALKSPLFDTAKFAKDLQAALAGMYQEKRMELRHKPRPIALQSDTLDP